MVVRMFIREGQKSYFTCRIVDAVSTILLMVFWPDLDEFLHT